MEPRHDEETENRGWFSRLHLSWPMLFLAGWLLYELTTKPTLGAVAVCLKFGWEDFRAAIWLRRIDPWRLRGRACFWLYLASGLAKTAGVAGLMSFAFVAVSPKGPAAQGARGVAIIEMFAWTGLTTLAGLGCATLTLAYAAVLARWGGFKLWLGRDIHRARRRNDWPPYDLCIVHHNRLEILLVGALIVFFFPLIILFILLIGIFTRFAVLSAVVCSFCIMGAVVQLLHCRDRAYRWLIASHPGQCWDMNITSPPDAESMVETFANSIK